MDEERLHFRRQFLLSREDLPSLSHWKYPCLNIGLYLYVHPDLDMAYKELRGIKVILLGSIYDPLNFEKNNEAILEDIINRSQTYELHLKAIKGYAGQYVIVYINGQVINIVHDPLALREIYYCTEENRVICGSQPNLVQQYSNPRLGYTHRKEVRRYYHFEITKIRRGRFWIGDETFYDGIKHLLPNHYLHVPDLRPIRYWPNHLLPTLELDEVVTRSCSFLQGILKAALFRQELMMAVTGGTDSRSLLAAAREFKDKIYFFINKHEGMDEKHPDIYVPSAIFKRIHVPFHIHNLDGEIDKTFKDIFLKNTFMAAELVLPAIYNIYYLRHSDKLNILGVGEIGRGFFGKAPNKISAYYLARSLKFKDSPYAVGQCQDWLSRVLPFARKTRVNIMTLLLWEQLLGNWGAVGNSESDIAVEEFDPFNSHYLYETLLSVDEKHLKKQEDIVFRKMIAQMWPELLDFPINPPRNAADHIRLALKLTGLYRPLKFFAYRIDRFVFMLKYGRIGARPS